MDSEKVENLLNLALSATEEERTKSDELNVGFEKTTNTWQVIVRYIGTGEPLEQVILEQLGENARDIQIKILTGGYAIMEIPEDLIDVVAGLTVIVYMEKPKRLFFEVNKGKSASCITRVQSNPINQNAGGNVAGSRNAVPTSLTGRDTIVAVIDSGIDYAHPDFRKEDGTTRILELWDQTLDTVYDSERINLALAQTTEKERYEVCPSRDISGHGTHVAGIAAGNGRASDGQYRGVAYESELLIVKLGQPRSTSFPRTTELMTAVDFCIQRAIFYDKPLAMNLSFGNNYGSHSGTSLIESYMNDMANRWRIAITVGSGNEGAAASHASGTLIENQTKLIELAVSEFESTVNLQIWKNYVDEVRIGVIHPNGKRIGILEAVQGVQRLQMENTELLLYYGEPSPYNQYQEIYIDFLPKEYYIDEGIWQIEFIPQKIVAGNYDLWLPAGGVLNEGTGFFRPSEETTLTIPSTAAKVLTVGAYDALYNSAASFSGRGFTRETNQVKPDIVAPGVDIVSCAPGGGYTSRTGTSMATPFVTGSAALMMQWGIVNGNDRYLYGEKLKAYLIRGARRDFSGFDQWPNPQLGWGALCLVDSF